MSVAAVNNTQSAFASENTVEAPATEEAAPAPDAGEEAPAPDAGEDAPEEDPAATQASLFQVAYAEVTVTEGDVAEVAAPTFTDAESGAAVDAPAGTMFALKSEIAGVNVDEVTGAITVGEPATAAAPATNVYEVAVTYPDGSKKTAVATVKVVPTEQAKLYQPEYTEVEITEGDIAEVAAPKFTDEESGEERDMPEGTTFALNAGEIAGVTVDEETGAITVGEPANAAAPSTLVYEVAVTYPDGSKDVVVATVKVVPTEQAKLYQPEYTEVTVTEGEVAEVAAPKFTDEESGEERDMPEGTTFALKDAPIDGVTINEETGEITVESTYAAVKNVYEVLVTYPDGSSEVVVATIDVIDTPAEEEPGEEQPGEEEPGEEQPGEEQPGEGDLARTGAEVGGLMALMASLIAGAASLFTIRRRKSEQ